MKRIALSFALLSVTACAHVEKHVEKAPEIVQVSLPVGCTPIPVEIEGGHLTALYEYPETNGRVWLAEFEKSADGYLYTAAFYRIGCDGKWNLVPRQQQNPNETTL